MTSRFSFVISAALLAGTAATAATITPQQPTLSDGCYQISSAEELYGFAAIVNGTDGFAKNKSACGKLLKDIVVNTDVLYASGSLKDENAASFVPWNPIDSFAGTFDGNAFDGNGHTIAGLYRDVSDEDDAKDVGFIRTLVGNPDGETVIKNLGIIDSYFAVKSLYVDEVVGIFAAKVVDSDASDDKDSHVKILNCFNMSSGNYGGSRFINHLLYEIDERVSVTIENCYNVRGEKIHGLNYGSLVVKNSFVLGSNELDEKGGIKTANETQFENGTVARALHEGTDGSIWGQDVGTDDYPNFSGEIKNSAASRYSVTFHTFNGDTASYFDSYISGFNTALPDTVEKENTVFFGWYDNSAFDGNPYKVIKDTAKGNLEYWAKLKNRFNIYFHCGEGRFDGDWNTSSLISEISREDTIFNYIEGAQASLPYAGLLRDGYVFAGWYDNEELSGTPVDSLRATDVGDKHFYASWFKMSQPQLDAADNCYAISDKAELYGFAAMVRGTYDDDHDAQRGLCGKLTKDIVVNENVLKRDGTLDESRMSTFMRWYTISAFSGTFDGQGHRISGLYGSSLFGSIYAGDDGKPVVIRNLKVNDSYARTSGLVSYVGDSTILSMDNCHYSGYIYGWSDNSAGGLINRSYGYINMFNSSFEGIVFSDGLMFVGGLVGDSYVNTVLVQNSMKGTIELVNTEKTSGDFTYDRLYGAGTLVGHLTGHALIANNYSITDFVGEKPRGLAGGLLGSFSVTRMLVGRTDVVEYKILRSFVLNNYTMGSMPAGANITPMREPVVAENNFYLKGSAPDSCGATAVAEADFSNGTLQTALHDYVQKDSSGNAVAQGITGDIWTQGAEYPEFAQPEKINAVILEGDTLDILKSPILVYKPGQSFELPTLEREDIVFNGWYATPDFTGDSVTAIAATDVGDKIFYADWDIIKFQVAVGSNSPGGRVRLWANGSNRASQYVNDSVPYGSTVSVRAEPYDGYVFVEWNNEICGKQASCSFAVTEDIAFTASFDRLSSSSVSSSSSAESSSSVSSSSSAKPVSSSVKSSSSSAKSSSSVKSSSSKAKSSSSSAKSSSSKSKSSSSKGKDAIVAAGQVPQFSLATVGRNIQVAGARVGSAYAVLDMQGRVMLTGHVDAANFSLALDRAGTYLVRIGSQAQTVKLR